MPPNRGAGSATWRTMTTRMRLRHVGGPFRGSAAVAAGLLTPAQLRSPLVQRLFRGVYVPAGMIVDHCLRAEAATLLLPGCAAISGRSAAVAHGVPLPRALDPVEVSVPEQQRFGPVVGMDVTRTELVAADLRPWANALVTTPVRTAFDLARSREVHDAVADVDAFLRATGITPPQVQRYLRGRRNHGVAQAREVLELADPRSESPRESVVRCHLNRAGLWPVPQLEVRLPNGSWARVDLGFERERVAVEYDGGWHALREQLAKDRARQNSLQGAGWTTVFVTAASLARGPGSLVADVKNALALSRWAA